MLDVSELTVSFGARTLFKGVNWHVAPGEKVGFVGDNGVGKSTFLKVIDGQLHPEAGSVTMPSGFRTGYLPQGGIEPSSRTLRQEAIEAFGEIQALKDSLEELRIELDGSCDPSPSLLDRYADIEQQLQAHDINRVEPKIHSVLTGLGFSQEDFDRPMTEFSGGWQMRAALARILLSSPDIMLLDEPTNYLDLEARMWLIEFLRECRRMVIMVCHDRYFLDQTVTRIADLENGTISDYYTNYSGYVEEKKKRLETLKTTRNRQEKELARQKRFIERFRYKARKASQVQSRLKKLNKFELVEVPSIAGSVNIVIPTPERSGLVVLELRNASAGYGGVPVFEGIELDVRRGDRLVLVGPNGAGKSTLMSVLAGEKDLDKGTLKTGHNVTLGYFAQESVRLLDGSLSILDTAMKHASAEFRPQLRGLLGAFGFSGDDIHKKVRVLSGGEKSRMALLVLLLETPNVLLLDEPTNHLDMKTKEVLLAALKQFGGTIVFVSHDRYFMNKLSTRVVEIGGKGITDYPGDYEHYLWRKQDSQNNVSLELEKKKKKSARPSKARESWQRKKELAALRRKLEKAESRLQAEIAELEAELEALEEKMSAIYSSGDGRDGAREAKKHSDIRDRLDERYSEWEKVESELRKISEEIK